MSGKILFIEDNEFHREVVTEYLNSRGYEILSVPNGLNFRDHLEEFQPDLILLDIKLPGGIDGFDLMAMLRRSPWYFLPVIVFSAYSFPKDKERAWELGARRFLVKPTVLTKINQVIAEELNLSD